MNKYVIRKRSKSRGKQMKDFLETIQRFKSENASLKKNLAYLDLTLEENEWSLLSNTLKLQGVPENKGENV